MHGDDCEWRIVVPGNGELELPLPGNGEYQMITQFPSFSSSCLCLVHRLPHTAFVAIQPSLEDKPLSEGDGFYGVHFSQHPGPHLNRVGEFLELESTRRLTYGCQILLDDPSWT